ncbi:MAG: GNAT family N-acetyltransferase [Pseudomonadota bacterium]
MIPTLQTERLTLRAPRMSDYEAFAGFYASERSRDVGGPFDGAGAYRQLAAVAGHWLLAGFGWWVMEHEGQPAGFAGIHHPPHKSGRELGWVLFEGFEGKGLALEATTAARDWGHANLPKAPLSSYIIRGNHRSEKLAERLGARNTGAAGHNPEADAWLHPEAAA